MPQIIKGTYISERWSTLFYHVPLQHCSQDINRIATFRMMLGKETQQNKNNETKPNPQSSKLQLFQKSMNNQVSEVNKARKGS